jgi:hypothetical protein
MELDVVLATAIPAHTFTNGRRLMTTLTDVELMEIHGGDWDWGSFLTGVALGIAFAASVSTGNVPGAIATGAALAADIYGAW